MNKKILVVDDDPDILKIVSAFLELERFVVLKAENIEKARELFTLEKPDLIILDIMLPDENGLDWLKEIKKFSPLTPVLLLTAKSSLSDKIIGFEFGADDYLPKPFEPLELVVRVKTLLRKRDLYEKKDISFIVLKDLRINLEAKKIFKGDKEIFLTPKEWAILTLLLSKPGKVFSREEIIKAIWRDRKIYQWSRVLDVHIKHLRDKLEDEPNSPEYIITVHGHGYKFREI